MTSELPPEMEKDDIEERIKDVCLRVGGCDYLDEPLKKDLNDLFDDIREERRQLPRNPIKDDTE